MALLRKRWLRTAACSSIFATVVSGSPLAASTSRKTLWLEIGAENWKASPEASERLPRRFHPAVVPASASSRKSLQRGLRWSRRDAILYAVGANASHGLKRTNRDKRNADDKMLADPLVGLNDDGVRHHGSLLRALRRALFQLRLKPRPVSAA
jgi:hypothetical protein